MIIGIIAGLITCALWGLSFVAPRAVVPFTAWDLAVARYAIFGFACMLLMLGRRFRPVGFTPSRATLGLLLGALGYTGYFISIAFAVSLAGPAVPPVIIGTMPVFLAIIANVRDRSIRWRFLVRPLLLIGSGVAVVNLSVLSETTATNLSSLLYGILASIGALVIWTIYGLVNGAVMRSDTAPDSVQWTCLQGFGAVAGSLLLLPLTSFQTTSAVPALDVYNFTAWALFMGLAGSWLATWCWIVASRRLPLALSAQLIVAETIFGLGYGFLFEARWPTVAETLGAMLQITGVFWAIMLFTKSRLTGVFSPSPHSEKSAAPP